MANPDNINGFLAVYPDASFRLYLTRDEALKTTPLFVAETHVDSAIPAWNDPDRKKYYYKFFDQHNNPYEINCDSWRILSVKKYYRTVYHTKIRIAAPDGEIKEVETDDSTDIETIANLLLFINNFRGYKDWSYYELKQENIKLIKENKYLKDELNES
jgi:hypothetical protein